MKKKSILFISFMVIMIVMGASDSLRGVFSLVFEQHFALSTFEVSLIVTISYIGNLVFLFFGGSFVDRYNKKKVFLTVLLLWMCGALLFVLTDNFYLLLFGMFLCMGTSTLINTTINILVPVVFAASPGLIVNVLFFVQGIGTSTSQNVAGRFATGFSVWKWVNTILLLLAVLGMILLCHSEIPDVKKEEKEKVSLKSILNQPAFIFLIVIFGFYFIAEHGILNWLVLYGTKELKLSTKGAAGYLSVFFGGITVGRLIFAPVVQKLGPKNSILVFGNIGMVFYALGIVLGGRAIALLSISGLSISIVYPTLLLLIQNYFKKDRAATATGVIISVATIFDIVFNMVFGSLTDKIGLKYSFYILPVSIIGFSIIYFLFTRTVKETANE
ncbi:major facilitator superfamily protein [Anaerocolumna cellulosilytica]|uniref:Major facilitator superfamily protein n=1 Tax=Anaerocolumna cellulosilytica TaxID=433286 RepID=A0A6S6R5Z1_9FIRM|nr:MFS transporter [Anaerocolumna cellulosilytica]MBB5195286.1 fucose permease [Anaerocolumna cellulosilytica]BCJ96759.1 major facilitator superfamily protein [Anaerocolumna cellulosilytica]